METWSILTFDEIVSGKSTFKDVGLPSGNKYKNLARKLKCADGTELSVQASYTHYCTPRNNIGPYTDVEVGYPTANPPESWRQYFDGDWEKEPHTDSVYGYIPVELVEEFIQAHGGEVLQEESQ